MTDITTEFVSEARNIVKDLYKHLELAEEGLDQRQNLEVFGQMVDRILGSAKTLAVTEPTVSLYQEIGSLAELCKIVGYRGSQIDKNENFYNVVVALLLDATEMLEVMIEGVGGSGSGDRGLSGTFLDRLKWVASQFDENTRSSLKVGDDLAAKSFDQIFKKLKVQK